MVPLTKNNTTKNGFYVIQFLSEAYTLQNNTTIDGQVISAGQLVIRDQYLLSIQENTNWYWKQQPLQHTMYQLREHNQCVVLKVTLKSLQLKDHVQTIGIDQYKIIQIFMYKLFMLVN